MAGQGGLCREVAGGPAPCRFPRALRPDPSSPFSCAGPGGPPGPSCLEPLPRWSDFGMDDSRSDSPAEPAERLGGAQEMQ